MAMDCIDDIQNIKEDKDTPFDDVMRHVEKMEKFLESTNINESTSVSRGDIAVHLYKPNGKFKGVQFQAEDTQAIAGEVPGSQVQVDLPAELLEEGEQNTILFCVLSSIPHKEGHNVFDGKMYGISVSNKRIGGLQQPIKITVTLHSPNSTEVPSCTFFNFSNNEFSTEGCHTDWRTKEGRVICSCDHLTYFAILMVPPNPSTSNPYPTGHAQNLTYISLIGCSISLTFLLFSILLFFVHRQVQSDVSKKVHINLAVALILLNGHFLPSSWMASLRTPSGCVYIALMLHYSLLAAFSWMAVEGFHLYLLLVRVFNIYIHRYLLKLGLFGWGVPAVVVLLVVIIDRDAYGLVVLPPSGNNTNSTLQMCYVRSEAVKWASVFGPFALLFLCNVCVLLLTVRQLVRLRLSGAPSEERRKHGRVWRDASSILAISCLLGVGWGIAFLSFGQLSLAATYLFCILNSLQGFFISIWFCASRRSHSEQTHSSTNTHTQTHGSTN
ncbi:hypothetical protein ACEWY4_027439 [Coilia grayii]|uniref:Uncharacterized protein n=1 Tax=Coilia grayii TaxID=363190 RepID=A0ABD1IQ35_9TELE